MTMKDEPLIIASKENKNVKRLCSIAADPKAECFLIEGKHLCDMAYESGCLIEVISTEKELGYAGISQLIVTPEILRKIAVSKTPSGILGVAKKPLSPEKLGKKVLVLDRVQDPGNVGTLLRTALSFGYLDVFLLPGTASPFSSKTVASSQGAIFPLRLYFPESEERLVQGLHEQGYTLLATSLRNAIPLQTADVADKPFALILGNEGKGVSDYLLRHSDISLRIEMDRMESLNVAIAGAILMYELR